MSDFKKHAKKILKSFDKEYELNKSEFRSNPEFSSSSTLCKKLKEPLKHEKKTDQPQQGEDDILDEE